VATDDVTAFVRGSLPPPPARVLEVGAGDGTLAAALNGYDMLGIDPASEVPDVQPVALLELDAPDASFDAAVAVVSLHHVEPLEASCERLAALVRPGGLLVVDEIDFERYDERAARWWLEQRPDAEHDPAEMVAGLRAHMHPLARIREALAPWFAVGEPVRGPYLYRWDVPPGLREVEEALIASGALPATGARFVSRRAASAGA
jgi:SAM-dependent methyltransferase